MSICLTLPKLNDFCVYFNLRKGSIVWSFLKFLIVFYFLIIVYWRDIAAHNNLTHLQNVEEAKAEVKNNSNLNLKNFHRDYKKPSKNPGSLKVSVACKASFMYNSTFMFLHGLNRVMNIREESINMTDKLLKKTMEEVFETVVVTVDFLTCVFLLIFVVQVVLCAGLVKRYCNWVEICLSFNLFITLFAICYTIALFFYEPFNAVFKFLLLMIDVFLWLCTQSYYQEMLKEADYEAKNPTSSIIPPLPMTELAEEGNFSME